MSKFWRYIFLVLSASVVLVFTASFSLVDTRLHLVFCDIGQGDAILIYRGSTQILVDGGPDRSVLSCLSSHMPFWDRKIEAVLMTHPDADHYSGLVDVVRHYDIGLFADSGVGKKDQGVLTLGNEISKKHIKVANLTAGTKIAGAGAILTSFWPDKEWFANSNSKIAEENVLGAWTTNGSANEFSLVLGLSYGQFDALLTGDIQPPEVGRVAEGMGAVGEVREWEVMQVPHHGSKNGLTRELLEVVNPKLTVISVGKKNRYGHPAKETLDILKAHKVKTLRTDTDGEIEMVTDGANWTYWSN